MVNALKTEKLDTTDLEKFRADTNFIYSHVQKFINNKFIMDFFCFRTTNSVDKADSVVVMFRSKFYSYSDYRPSIAYYFVSDKKALKKFNSLVDIINKFATKQTFFPVRNNKYKNIYQLPRTTFEFENTVTIELEGISIDKTKTNLVWVDFYQ